MLQELEKGFTCIHAGRVDQHVIVPYKPPTGEINRTNLVSIESQVLQSLSYPKGYRMPEVLHMRMKEKETDDELNSGSRKRCSMNTAALTPEELSYLLGLYCADGYLTKRKNSAGVFWCLQGNEEPIANRVEALLTRTGLRPRLHFSRHGGIEVAVYSMSLSKIFPVKKNVLKRSVAWRFLKRYLSIECGIPFFAGLIDGDGRCKAYYNHRSHGFFGYVSSHWDFSQTKFPSLREYLHEFIETLSPSGSTIRTYRRQKGSRERADHVVLIRKSGMQALLQNGLDKYSWKVEMWQQQIAELQRRLSSLRSSVCTVGQVARLLGLSRAAIWKRCKMGNVKTLRGHGRTWYLIPSEEVERLIRERNGYTTSQLARKLDVTVSTVSMLCKAGKIRALRGGNRKRYLIPVDEAERLSRERRRK